MHTGLIILAGSLYTADSTVLSRFSLSYKNMNATLQQFCEIAQSDNVAISINKLAQYLELPVSPILQELFDLYDKVTYRNLYTIAELVPNTKRYLIDFLLYCCNSHYHNT